MNQEESPKTARRIPNSHDNEEEWDGWGCRCKEKTEKQTNRELNNCPPLSEKRSGVGGAVGAKRRQRKKENKGEAAAGEALLC